MRKKIAHWVSLAALSPTLLVLLVAVFGFSLWTGYMSLTPSRMLPVYEISGFEQYVRLFNSPRWWVSYTNLFIFGFGFIAACLGIGIGLAILIDQRIRGEGIFRTIFLYPLAISFVVTGVAWRWILNPELGLQSAVRSMGWESFTFDWLVRSDMSIYTLVIAGGWQSAGFVMALFLAGLRGVDAEIWRATKIDGIPSWRVYVSIVLPMLRPVLMTALVLLALAVVRSFDLVAALTAGGPGFSSSLPAVFLYEHMFNRQQIGVGAASAMMILSTALIVVVPYLYLELRQKR